MSFVGFGGRSGNRGSFLDWILRRLESELTEAQVELVSIGDVNGDGVVDYSLSLTKEIEYSFKTFFGTLEWSREIDRDFVVLSGEDGPTIRNLNRFTGIDGDIIETRSLGDINGDGIDDFATFTGSESGYYGRKLLPDGLDVAGARGFYGDAVEEVYITLGGAKRSPVSLAEFYGVDGNVVSVKSLGDINGDGFNDLSALTGGFVAYYGAAGSYYGREVIDQYVIFGGDKDLSPISLNALTNGQTVIDVAAIGDINGDGIVDLAATTGGFYGLDGGGGYYGEVREDVLVLLGGENGYGDPQSLTKSLGTEGRALDVQSIDLNGDGISELAVQVGGYYGDMTGASGYYGLEITDVFLFTGEDAAPLSLGRLAGDGRTANEVYDLGDINGDGFGDLGIGAAGYYGNSNGGYYGNAIDDVLVIFGNPNGAVDPLNLNDFIGTAETLHGAVSLGDLNGDGFDDIGVACYYGANGFEETLVVFGGRAGAQGAIEIRQFGLGDGAFGNVTPLGDANGDGFADFSVEGYYGAATGYYGEALNTSSYVIFGGKEALSVSAFAQNARVTPGDTVATIELDSVLGSLLSDEFNF